MKILIAGSSGLIGSKLVESFRDKGDDVFALIRKNSSSHAKNTIMYDPIKGEIDLKALEGFDVWINLAGDNIASGYWTSKKKQKILSSRISVTSCLARACFQLKNPPKVILNASAIGFYGNRGDEILNESSPAGTGFLADVCQMWEKTIAPAEEKGVRVVKMRIGVVLSDKGGALKKMLFPFKLGLCGVIGSGKQYMSWVSIEDVKKAVDFLITNEKAKGPINIVSPNPVTNYTFTKTLGSVLKRPTIFPLPAPVAKLIMGQMAEEMLLSSIRAEPKALTDLGFEFKHSDLKKCLEELI